jgi:hypothetical protein
LIRFRFRHILHTPTNSFRYNMPLFEDIDFLGTCIKRCEKDVRKLLIREQREDMDFVKDCIQWHQTDHSQLKEARRVAEEEMATQQQKLDRLVKESEAEIAKLRNTQDRLKAEAVTDDDNEEIHSMGDCILWHSDELSRLKEVQRVAVEKMSPLRRKWDRLVEESKAEIVKQRQVWAHLASEALTDFDSDDREDEEEEVGEENKDEKKDEE